MKIQTKQIMSFRFYLSNDFIQIFEHTLNYVEMELFETAQFYNKTNSPEITGHCF